jgi:hypothetical protein
MVQCNENVRDSASLIQGHDPPDEQRPKLLLLRAFHWLKGKMSKVGPSAPHYNDPDMHGTAATTNAFVVE